MAQTYTRQSSFADGDTITAALFNNEFNQLVNSFAYSSSSSSSTGHQHDGTAGGGGNIGKIGDLDFLNKITVNGNTWEFYVEVSSAAAKQLVLQDGALVPNADSDLDLGTSSLYFKDAYIDSITTTGNVAVGGNLTVTGTTTFNGGTITMGDAATDNVVFGADIDSNIIPDDDNTYDLGSSSQQWKDIYIDGVAYLDAIDFNGTTITATAAELNLLDGVTSTTTELNLLDGVTSTTAELNILDGVTSTAAELNILDGVTSTTAELNILDGVTASTDDINLIDGITNGTVIASKAIITDSNKDITGGRNITISGELDAGSLDVSGDVDVDGTLETDALSINGTVVTSTAAELNILDGVTSTAAELNILDGVTSTAAELNILDGVTSTAAELNILDGVTSTAAELNILDGVTASAADINLIDGITNGTVIASKAIITDSDKDITGGRNITISGELDAATLDISGDADIDGTLEADAITIGGITLAETISDTVGAMVTSNTETNIAVTYDDSDNTLDFVIGTLNQDTTGLAATATALATARTIHGVSFDGTANIDLSEVIQDTVGAMVSSNTETNVTVTYQDSDGTLDFVFSGSADTTGNAATATALETARTIGGVSFDGSANITPTTFTAATFSGDVNVDSGLLFADVSADKVGIGTTSPQSIFHTRTSESTSNHNSGGGFSLTSSSTAGSRRALIFLDADNGNFSTSSDGAYAFIEKIGDGGNLNIVNQDTANINLMQGSNVRFSIDSSGNIDIHGRELILDEDGDSSIQASTDDVIQFKTTTNERMRIDSSGNIGIGTTSMDSILHIVDVATQVNIEATAGDATLKLECTGENFWNIFNDTSDSNKLKFEDNGNGVLTTIDRNGNVGIGTSSPSAKLEVTGSSDGDLTSAIFANTVQGGTNDTVAVELQLAGTSGQVAASTLRAGKGEDWTSGTSRSGFLAIEAVLDGTNRQMAYFGSDGDGSSKVSFSTNNSERMRIDSSGNIGMGTTAPQGILHLDEGSADDCKLICETHAGGDSMILWTQGNSGPAWAMGLDAGSGTSDGLSIAYKADGFPSLTGQSKVVITTDGKVGIGTTSPQRQFHIAGGTNTGLKISGNNSGSASGDGFDIFVRDDNSGVELVQREDTFMTFHTNNSERMRIASNGVVGIGTTSPHTTLVVNGGGFADIALQSSNSGTGSGQGGLISIDTSNNLYLWNFESAATIFGTNNAERMRLTNDGKLGFNFTAPAALIDIKSGGATSTPLRVLASSSTTSDFNDLWSVAEISGHGRMSIFDASQNEDIRLDTNGTSTFAGALSKGSGSFKIDHPLESKKDTHHLYHSFIEGPQVDNLYRGTVTLNNGIATINLDAVSNMTEGTFVALNREVQCYTTNETDWDAVKGNVEGNILTISCQNTSSSATVSWLVIGERQDKNIYSSTITDENGKLIVEKLKSEEE